MTKHSLYLYRFRRIDVVVLLLFSLIVVYIYKLLPYGFFSQDEWASLGLVKATGNIIANVSFTSPMQIIAGNQRLFGSLINNAFHLYFPFEMLPFVIFSISLHTVNTFLIYLLSIRLSGGRLVSAIAGLFFAVLYTPSEALMWVSANTTVLPNATFLLVSLLAYFSYLATKKDHYKFISYSFFIISLLFKESSLFLFLVYPLLDWLFDENNRSLISKIRRHGWLIGYAILYLLVRFFGLTRIVGDSGVFVTGGGSTIYKLFSHAMSYPVTSFSQLFIPNTILFKVADVFGALSYPFLAGHPMKNAIETILITDLLSVYLTIMIPVIVAVIWYMHPHVRKQLLFGYLFTYLSFLPYVAVDRPLSSYLESRYYYLAAIGASFLMAASLVAALGVFRKRRVLGVMVSIVAVLTISIYGYKNAQYVVRSIAGRNIVASERIKFLKSIKTQVRDLPDEPIFFISGDSPGFYGLADLAVPFQQGMGYTLMVWFYESGKIPASLLRETFLWNINTQGYKKAEGKGFGYFWNKQSLVNLYKENPEVTTEQLVGFTYVASEKKLVDVTDALRRDLNALGYE